MKKSGGGYLNYKYLIQLLNEVEITISELAGNNDNIDGVELGELVDYVQPTNYIVHSTDYSNEYLTPVLTPGQSFILGYTDEVDGIYNADGYNPVIIFDDFTTSNHWVDFRFKVKSSAMKILIPKSDDFNFKYVYYIMQTINFIYEEHGRKWISKYSKIKILLPSIEVQNKIVAKLDKFYKITNGMSEGLPAEIEKRKEQYEYYRDKLLSFKKR